MNQIHRAILTISVSIMLVLAGCPTVGGGGQSDTHSNIQTTDNGKNKSPLTEVSVSDTNIATEGGDGGRNGTDNLQTQIKTSIGTTTPSDSEDSYREFAAAFHDGLLTNSETPVRIHAYGSRNDTWYVVINATAPSQNRDHHTVEWAQVANSYAAAFFYWEQDNKTGKVPERMVVLDLNSSNYITRPGVFQVRTEWAKALANESITEYEYDNRWKETIREQTDREIRIAEEMDASASNTTYHEQDEN